MPRIDMDKLTQWEIQPTASKGQSILVGRRPNDGKFTPSISLQFPTEIAEEIKEVYRVVEEMHFNDDLEY